MSSSDPNISPSFTETLRPSAEISMENTDGFSNKNIIIIVTLCILILLILLNTNIRDILRNIVNIAYNLVMRILVLLGFVTGNVINTTANIGGNVARTGIDITEGTLHSVGNILTGGNATTMKNLDTTLNTSTISQSNNIPLPDNTSSPIQNSIVADKQSWCLVGEYKGTRGCIEVGESDKCMSGQVYPQQKMCLNPALTQNT